MIESGLNPFMMKTLCQYPANGYAHHNIKSTPNWSENPLWRLKTWFVQCHIPIVYRDLNNYATKKPYDRADDNTNKNVRKLSFQLASV